MKHLLDLQFKPLNNPIETFRYEYYSITRQGTSVEALDRFLPEVPALVKQVANMNEPRFYKVIEFYVSPAHDKLIRELISHQTVPLRKRADNLTELNAKLNQQVKEAQQQNLFLLDQIKANEIKAKAQRQTDNVIAGVAAVGLLLLGIAHFI